MRAGLWLDAEGLQWRRTKRHQQRICSGSKTKTRTTAWFWLHRRYMRRRGL